MKKIGKSFMATLMALVMCIGTGVTAFANSLNAVALTGDDRRMWIWIVVIVVVVVVLIIVLLLLRRRNKRSNDEDEE